MQEVGSTQSPKTVNNERQKEDKGRLKKVCRGIFHLLLEVVRVVLRLIVKELSETGLRRFRRFAAHGDCSYWKEITSLIIVAGRVTRSDTATRPRSNRTNI